MSFDAFSLKYFGLLFALLLASCVGGQKGQVKSTPDDKPPLQQVAAELEPALKPVERNDTSLWAEAARRSEVMRKTIANDIASAKPQSLAEAKKTKEEIAVAAEQTVERKEEGAKPAKQPKGKPRKVKTRPVLPIVEVMQTLTTADGLPSNHVTALYVDGKDLWVGTNGAGLGRYNFNEDNWQLFTAAEGLASDYVTDILPFGGRVFVGTKRGLSIWDGSSWESMEKFKNKSLSNISLGIGEGAVWVAAKTMRGGLISFDGEKWKDRSNLRRGSLLNNVTDFQFDENSMWIGTASRGVYQKKNRNWLSYTVVDGLASNFVYTLGVLKGSVYLGGCCGLSVYEDGSWTVFDVPEGLPHSTVNVIATDKDFVWLGSKKGLAMFDGYEFTSLFTKDGLADDRITALYVTDTDVWVGTTKGLNRLEKSF